jgi:hypothetical protein
MSDMTPDERLLLSDTRRQFFKTCGIGLGQIALASLLQDGRIYGADAKALNPMAPKPPMFPPKVKNVIFLHMAGAPSQLDMFDYKPKLKEFDGKVAPDELIKGKRFAFMDTFMKAPPHLLGCHREFKQYGQAGFWFSSLLPHLATVADDLTMMHGISTDNFNHAPAKCAMNTGSIRFGRPSMGAWITYGIGSESSDLPGFVVLQSGPRGPRGGAALWSSGFLPTAYQGVPFRSGGDPILDLSTPKGIPSGTQQQTLAAIRDLNQIKLDETGDDEINTRIAAYEMAYRMQTSGPDLIDFSKESKETLEMYGVEPGKSSYANNCLLAARLVERGVRFVQLYHTEWDHHADIGQPLDQVCKEVDQPTAALIRDLKRRGLLDHTLVIWGGEFGRTPMAEGRELGDKFGRNHHIDAFTMFMAGAGVKPGTQVGGTDELGFSSVGERMEVHDLHATLLHLLGVDHLKLTYTFQGRAFRLTDTMGRVVKSLLA